MSAEHRFELLSLPGWSRAESLKMLFHLAKQPFLDRQLNINAWQAYKQKSADPFFIEEANITNTLTFSGSTIQHFLAYIERQ